MFRQDPDSDQDKGRRREPRRGGPRLPTPRRSQTPLPPGRPFRTLAFWVFVGLLALVAYRMYQGNFMATPRVEVSYTRFIQEVEAGNIEKIQIIENMVTGELKRPSVLRAGAHETQYKAFKTNILGDGSELPDRIWKTNPGIEIEVRNAGFNWLSFLFTSLPFLLLLPLWLLLIRQMQGSGSAALKFGKTKAKVLIESAPKVTFKDVAGCDEAKQELQEIIEFLKEPQKFQRLGGRIPKGALLLGPPGSGKTLLAKAVAGEAGVPFFSMSGSDFVEMFVGVGASVTGDTPILIREGGSTRLIPIGELVDRFYQGNAQGSVVSISGIETLGIDRLSAAGHPTWTRVVAVYRHRATEIYEIQYGDATLRTTADHGVFVDRDGELRAVAANDLRVGDRLADLISPVTIGPTPEPDRKAISGAAVAVLEPETATWRPHDGASVIRAIQVLPFDGFVYDLCGCENEAFYGGEQPILLHNSRVRDLFEQGKRNAPCIIFVDEIDAVGRHRGAGLGGGHDEREQTLNQLLVEMDGFDSNEGVIMIAATNRPDVLDPALMRPGRFDRQIVVDWPDVRGREGILRVHTRNIPLADDVDLKLLARGTPGMAGADIANLVNEAALLAARRNHKKVTLRDFEDAKDKVMLGTERKSLVMTEEERKTTAYHEAGHALVAWLLPGSDPVDKVTIIPRGRALGVTSYLPSEERHARSRDDLIRIISMMMGGRAAEQLVFNHLTTGAANDLERATGLARKMVCELGMSDLGPLTFGKKEEMVFLGREIATHKDYSEHTAVMIDQEVRRIAEDCYQQAFNLLKDNVEKLHLLAGTLLEREVLDGDQMNRLLRGEKLEPARGSEPDREPVSTAPEKEAPRKEGDRPLDLGQPSPRPAGA
jgi:ATP-dependent metalloprotease FtsH